MPNDTRPPADCHPDKPRKTADGRCDACYVRDRYQNDPAVRQRQLERAAKQRAKRHTPREPEVCNDCGASYVPKTRDKQHPTCRDCRSKHGGRPMIGIKRCAWCYSEFKYYQHKVKYCTNECFKQTLGEGKSEQIRWKQCKHCQEWRTHRVKHHCTVPAHIRRGKCCKHCGDYIIPERRYTYCGELCAYFGTHGTQRQVWFQDCRTCGRVFSSQQPLERACSPACRIGQPDFKISKSARQAIYERDQWKCQLCRKIVGKTRKHPHPRSASLDHIVPRSLGGSDEPSNLQLAHLRCNVEKSTAVANGGEQLRLVG